MVDDNNANLPLRTSEAENYQVMAEVMCTKVAASEADWQMSMTDHGLVNKRDLKANTQFWNGGSLSAQDKFGIDYATVKTRYGTTFSAAEMNIVGPWLQNLNADDQEVCDACLILASHMCSAGRTEVCRGAEISLMAGMLPLVQSNSDKYGGHMLSCTVNPLHSPRLSRSHTPRLSGVQILWLRLEPD